MVTIHTYGELLTYVNRFGLAPRPSPGWIPVAQERLCKLADAIERAAGKTFGETYTRQTQRAGWPVYAEPIQVHYARPGSHRRSCGMAGVFHVTTHEGTILVDAERTMHRSR